MSWWLAVKTAEFANFDNEIKPAATGAAVIISVVATTLSCCCSCCTTAFTSSCVSPAFCLHYCQILNTHLNTSNTIQQTHQHQRLATCLKFSRPSTLYSCSTSNVFRLYSSSFALPFHAVKNVATMHCLIIRGSLFLHTVADTFDPINQKFPKLFSLIPLQPCRSRNCSPSLLFIQSHAHTYTHTHTEAKK